MVIVRTSRPMSDRAANEKSRWPAHSLPEVLLPAADEYALGLQVRSCLEHFFVRRSMSRMLLPVGSYRLSSLSQIVRT